MNHVMTEQDRQDYLAHRAAQKPPVKYMVCPPLTEKEKEVQEAEIKRLSLPF